MVRRHAHHQLKEKKSILASFSHILRIFLLLIFLTLTAVVIGVLVFIHRTWSDKSSKNILLVYENIDGSINDIILAHIDPQQNQIQTLLLPANLPVTLTGGYGEYPLRSVYPLLQLDKRPPEFIKGEFSFGLKNVIDEVWVTKEEKYFQGKPDLNQIFKDVLLYKIQTPLTIKDRIWLYQFFTSLRLDQVSIKEIHDEAEWQKAQISTQFAAQPSECSVAVINTTATRGMGTVTSNILENSGIHVIRLDDLPQDLDQSTLLTAQRDPFCQETRDHIAHAFPFTLQLRVTPNVQTQYRANIVVLLGKDLATQYEKKSQ